MMANTSERSSEVITPEHAVLIPQITAASSLMAYVEAVATVIGSCHIHSVYEDQDFIKIYLNDKKFVDFLVNTGISVLGRRVNVDYAIPRADKVTLKSVDPIIPDSILMRFLCFYGTPVSTIIHEKIASNLEYSHIECGTRKIYMNLFQDKKPPTKVSIQYQDVCYRFEMSVERYDKKILEIDSSTTEEANEEDTVDEAQEVESVQSLKPNIDELVLNEEVRRKSKSRGLKSPTPAQTAYREKGNKNNGENSVTFAARKIKSRAAKGWYKNKIKKAKNISTIRGMNNIVSREATPSVRGRRRGRGGFKRGRGRGSYSNRSIPSSTPIQEVSTILNDDEDEADAKIVDVSSEDKTATSDKSGSYNISQYPLTTEELKKFMFQTRCSRAPIQLAQEVLAKKNAPEAIDDLLKQLQEYHDVIKIQNLRLRIRRLVKTIQSSIDEKTTS